MGSVLYLNLPNSHASTIMQDLMPPMWCPLFVLHGETGPEGVREKGRSVCSRNYSVTTPLLSTAQSVYESCLVLTSTAWQAQHTLYHSKLDFPSVPAQLAHPAALCNDKFTSSGIRRFTKRAPCYLLLNMETVCLWPDHKDTTELCCHQQYVLFSFLPPLPFSSF